MSRMIETPDLLIDLAPATAGDIAVINLESARQQSWSRFWRAPERTGTAETIVEQEQLTAQFVGDLAAFDRLEILTGQLARRNPEAAQTSLIAAQVACATHRFAEATASLAQAVVRGAPSDATERLSLTLDQATGQDFEGLLAVRRERAGRPGSWGELVPLGALLADLGEFDEAERTYHRALREYPDVSPFAVAWVCFQLGVLWGELIPDVQSGRAASWYRKAIEYLPSYVKARVHLAEIYSTSDRMNEAEALLLPVVASGDPEVSWRLADVLAFQGKNEEAEAHINAARSGFESLLERHLLAFADHGAEFYAGSGNDYRRAIQLARINADNRPTMRAFEQSYDIATTANDPAAAIEFLSAATTRWGHTPAFSLSPLQSHRLKH
ncbi:MAG: tetratricopeptide repeat protein [Hyphomicrobiales bacterium]|nr:tetratricopeptide repeat protein [Hyphomicrobiales bacterium]